MRTKTIEIEETNFMITVEVTRAGEIFEAQMFAVHMETTPIECTNQVRESNYLSKLVAEKFAELDWNDRGDEGLETLRENVAKIIGVRAI